MSWAAELSDSARHDLKRLPSKDLLRIMRAIGEMETDPIGGDVRPFCGPQWRGRYRKRVGNYRIIFSADHAQNCLYPGDPWAVGENLPLN